jgi:acyl-coenzyme A synthetase/AMP-(fatty) acid ligase
VPDADRGEAVKALVQLAPGYSAGAEQAENLMAVCRERLAPFKLPRVLEFVDSLPRDPSGKLPKRLLAEGPS